MALLQVEPGLFIWTWIAFLTVFILLRIFAWKHILSGLNARAEKIQSDIEEAEKTKEEAKKNVVAQREQMDQVKKEASSIIENARHEAQNLKEKMIVEANDQIVKNKLKLLSDIENAQIKAVEDVRKEATELACNIAEIILKRTFTEKDNEALISDFIAKAGDKYHQNKN